MHTLQLPAEPSACSCRVLRHGRAACATLVPPLTRRPAHHRYPRLQVGSGVFALALAVNLAEIFAKCCCCGRKRRDEEEAAADKQLGKGSVLPAGPQQPAVFNYVPAPGTVGLPGAAQQGAPLLAPGDVRSSNPSYWGGGSGAAYRGGGGSGAPQRSASKSAYPDHLLPAHLA